MIVRFTKVSDERHRLDVTCDDGAVEGRELETRSFLVHDLAHYAVEAQAGIADGFWGLLTSGASLDELGDMNALQARPGLARAESLAAPFQSLWHGRLERERYLEIARVDGAFVDAALEKMRKLTGHWRATPYRAFMELRWPP